LLHGTYHYSNNNDKERGEGRQGISFWNGGSFRTELQRLKPLPPGSLLIAVETATHKATPNRDEMFTLKTESLGKEKRPPEWPEASKV
jgi:hypothetical protein